MNAFVGLSFIGLFFVIFAILLLPTIFFLLTLQRALSKCSPHNRTMTPGLVWLQIIPFFGFIWQFFVVIAVANSLENEFAARRIPEERKPGQSVGLAMCVTRVCTVIPFVGIFAGLASVVLWIIYWVKIAGLSRKLDVWYGAGYRVPPYGYPTPPAVGGGPYPAGLQPPTHQPVVPATTPAPPAAAPPASPPSENTERPTAPESAETAAPPFTEEPATKPGQAASPAACAVCGASVSSEAGFCSNCGAKVDRPGGD